MKQLIALVLALGSPCLSSADPVNDWNVTATTASFAAGLDNEFGCVDPLHESRMLAMMHVAIHDALNAIDRRYQRTRTTELECPEHHPKPRLRQRHATCSSRCSRSSRLISAPRPVRPSPSSKPPMRTRWRPFRTRQPRRKVSASVRPQPQPFSHCDLATGPTRRFSISITKRGPIPETSSSFPACRSRRRPRGER